MWCFVPVPRAVLLSHQWGGGRQEMGRRHLGQLTKTDNQDILYCIMSHSAIKGGKKGGKNGSKVTLVVRFFLRNHYAY